MPGVVSVTERSGKVAGREELKASESGKIGRRGCLAHEGTEPARADHGGTDPPVPHRLPGDGGPVGTPRGAYAARDCVRSERAAEASLPVSRGAGEGGPA